MKLFKRSGQSLIEVLVIGFMIILLPLIIFLLSLWTDGNLEYGLALLKGHAVLVPYWLSLVITIVFSAVIMPFNIIMEIIKLFY